MRNRKLVYSDIIVSMCGGTLILVWFFVKRYSICVVGLLCICSPSLIVEL